MCKKSYTVGFDCEFLDPPPDILQTECPVCLQIIREPHQVTCCGKSSVNHVSRPSRTPTSHAQLASLRIIQALLTKDLSNCCTV